MGAGASTKALDASAPITIWPLSADKTHISLDDVWSRMVAYVSPRVIVPCIHDEPLHGDQALLVPLSFTT